MKRLLDVFAAAIGLFFLWPLLLVIALLVKLGDRGPVFYRQERVGHRGTPFRIWKFRTMVVSADAKQQLITVGSDARITRVGYWLRKLKFDELGQLINVLKGEMSLVGPRPEVPKYVALYSDQQKEVLQFKPGITDPASIKYSNESELLAQAADPERKYVDEIMPDKIRINLEYAKSATVLTDVQVILKTLAKLAPFSLVG